MWTERQRLALGVMLVGVTCWFGVRYYFNRSEIDPRVEAGARAGEVLDRIDPNTADRAALAALPQIGPALAQRIVEEREAFRAANPGAVPYRELNDLSRVKGIGEATLAAMEPYLIFSSSLPATRGVE